MKSEVVEFLGAGKGNPRNSEGAFISLKNGNILFVYTHYIGGVGDVCDVAVLAAIESSDQGRTWTPNDQKRIIMTSDDGNIYAGCKGNVMSVSLHRVENDEKIAMIYLRKRFIFENEKFCEYMPMISFSSDEGQTWSEPVSMNNNLPSITIICNDRLIRLRSGRLIAPFSQSFCGGGPGCVNIYYSDDEGKTWSVSPDTILPPLHSQHGLHEPGVVELKDGRLLLWARSDMGYQYTSISEDQGMTWSEAVPEKQFISPAAPLSCKRMPDGRLIAVWCDNDQRWGIVSTRSGWEFGRTPFAAAFSDDDGVTWKDHILLETRPDHGYCYTAIHFTEDNGILLAYCCGGDSNNTWTLQDSCIRRLELD